MKTGCAQNYSNQPKEIHNEITVQYEKQKLYAIFTGQKKICRHNYIKRQTIYSTLQK